MKVDDPITCAEYALEKGLLQITGWKSLRKFAKNKKKLDRLLKQAKLNDLGENQFISLVLESQGYQGGKVLGEKGESHKLD